MKTKITVAEGISGPTERNELTVLLDTLSNEIKRYVVVGEPAVHAIALWVVHTWCLEAATVSPRLRFDSIVPGCGKTTVLSILRHVVKDALPLSNATTATIFRIINKSAPTLLMDEADTYIAKEELQGILNSGHSKSGAYVLRCDTKTGDVVKFSTWAPVVIAGLGRFSDPLETRCIRVMLQRRLPSEKIDHFVETAEKLAAYAHLKVRLQQWSSANTASLSLHQPILPPGLSNRDGDNWRALLSIADLASKEWAEKSRAAAIALTSAAADLHEAPLEILLSDSRDAFDTSRSERLASKTLLETLNALPDRPWSTWKSGRGLSAHHLSILLRPLGIRPQNFRFGDAVLKGYERCSFEDAFLRYCPPKKSDQPK